MKFKCFIGSGSDFVGVFFGGFSPTFLVFAHSCPSSRRCLGKQLLNLSWKICAFIKECCAAFCHMAAARLGDVMSLSLQPDFFSDLPWV